MIATAITEDMLRLLEACAGMESDAQKAFVDQECSGRPEVQQWIERVLASTTAIAGDTLLRDGGLWRRTEELLAEAEAVSDRIGRYRILRILSRGGMGTVLLGVRSDLENSGLVAIKVINSALDQGAFLNVFNREREILSSLKSHPNIVHLEDADVTAAGVPYLVMEYIDGLPLVEYCEKNELSVEDRLRLFLTVCGAVTFAHQREIVHRDLKPNNVLVTASGSPKLLDFGIAKLLATSEREASVSIVEQKRIMTIEYASPEQVRGEPLDVRTDVYSLGVVLYRMLAGVLPYNLALDSVALRQKAVCDQEPMLPSVAVQNRSGGARDLERTLSGDLDNILLKALRKRADERYGSVEQFSEDIQRHLHNEPVRARPNTWAYSAGRFVLRHRLAVVTAAAFMVLLFVSVVLVGWQAHVARLQRARAENRFNDVRQLASWLLFDFQDQIERLAGGTEPRRQLVQHAQLYLDRLASEQGNDVSLESDLASSYIRLGDVQGNPRYTNQGDVPAALVSYQKGLRILDRLHNSGVKDAVSERTRTTLEEHIVDIDESMGKIDEALALQEKVVAELEILARNGNGTITQRNLAVGHQQLGEILAEQGKLQPAKEHFEAAMRIIGPLHREHPDDPQFARDVTVMYAQFGNIDLSTGNQQEALDNYRKAFEIREKVLAAHPDDRQYGRDVANVADSMATVLTNMKRFPEALEFDNRVLKIVQQQSIADSKDMTAESDLSDSYANRAQVLFELHRYREALEDANRSLETRQVVSRIMSTDVTTQASMADTYFLKSLIQERTGQAAAAIHSSQMGLEIIEPIHARDHAQAEYYEVLAKGYFTSAKASEDLHTGDSHVRALVLYQKAMDCYQDLKKDNRLTDDGAKYFSETAKALNRLRSKPVATRL